MIDGVRVAARDDRAVMTQLVQLISLWKKAQHGHTSLLQVAEVCPACPGKVGTSQLYWLLYLGCGMTSLTSKMA